MIVWGLQNPLSPTYSVIFKTQASPPVNFVGQMLKEDGMFPHNHTKGCESPSNVNVNLVYMYVYF